MRRSPRPRTTRCNFGRPSFAANPQKRGSNAKSLHNTRPVLWPCLAILPSHDTTPSLPRRGQSHQATRHGPRPHSARPLDVSGSSEWHHDIDPAPPTPAPPPRCTNRSSRLPLTHCMNLLLFLDATISLPLAIQKPSSSRQEFPSSRADRDRQTDETNMPQQSQRP